MVLLHVKRMPREEHSQDYDEFLFTAALDAEVGPVIDAAAAAQNARVRLKWCCAAGRELQKHSAATLAEEPTSMLLAAVEDGERYLKLMTKGSPTTAEEALQFCETIRGACMIAFPEACSGADAQKKLVAEIDGEATPDDRRAFAHRLLSVLDADATTEDILQGRASMWWCSKALERQATLAKYAGKNDKTKLVVKLTRDGGNAPQRESGLDPRTQREMMAHYFKKQEEQKKLVEDDDISFGNSEWANPQGLKGQLLGMGSVKFRPGAM